MDQSAPLTFTVTISKANVASSSDPKALLWGLILLFIIVGSVAQAC